MPAPSTPPELSRRRSDGEQTHSDILETAMRLASMEGLGGLTIGRLATELGISKSGVYAHFRSKDRLQRETIDAARNIFEQEVIDPGMAAAPGLGQLRALCEAFLSYVERGVFPGGCFFGQILAEFDGQPGPLRDAVAENQRGWLGMIAAVAREARSRGELSQDADLRQLAFELSAALEMANYLHTLYADPVYLAQGRDAVNAAIARALPRR